MSDYTLEDVRKFASPRFGGEHDWDNFLFHLRAADAKGVVLYMPQIGVASLAEEGRHASDNAYFVFAIKNLSGERNFMVTTTSSSFGGIYHGVLAEVQSTVVQKTTWEQI